ncbi:hypothetical protein BGZ83_001426 [Gryganskiella cystojenkinii]|nr:hypothetical protein BGZ83_001426 [Gryganskiella cystojenkinii]
MHFFFRTLDGSTVPSQLKDNFTLNDFLQAVSKALGSLDRDTTLSFRYTVGSKALNVNNTEEFDRQKAHISKDCMIFVLGRLMGGGNILSKTLEDIRKLQYLCDGSNVGGNVLSETFEDIAKQQLRDELDKVTTQSTNCSICLDTNRDCLRACCAWICREDFERWFLEKQVKVSCIVCSKAIVLRLIFKTPEYIATLQAVEDEREILRNMDCQRCLECNALMHNESMNSCQTCVKCGRKFCFFCNRKWNAANMIDRQNSCGKECVYETMITFRLIPFHYNHDIMIPSERTCPQCFNFGAYDGKCKYHTCTVCKTTFCFLCLEVESECNRKHESRYDHACVRTAVRQNYSMFPRLTSL